MKAYIIEDDLSTAINYEVILHESGISDCTVFNSIIEAKEKIQSDPPDIAILDLYLKNELSVELIPFLNKEGSDIIVVTGFPKSELMEQAIDMDVVTFLPKPVNVHTLKFQIHSIAKKRNAQLDESFCFVKSKNKYVRVPYSNIIMLETEGNYTSIFTTNGKYILKRSLKNVSNDLPGETFTRVHRNFVINNNRVKHLDLKNNVIELLDNTKVQIGGKYRNEIKNAIGSKFNIIS